MITFINSSSNIMNLQSGFLNNAYKKVFDPFCSFNPIWMIPTFRHPINHNTNIYDFINDPLYYEKHIAEKYWNIFMKSKLYIEDCSKTNDPEDESMNWISDAISYPNSMCIDSFFNHLLDEMVMKG